MMDTEEEVAWVDAGAELLLDVVRELELVSVDVVCELELVLVAGGVPANTRYEAAPTTNKTTTTDASSLVFLERLRFIPLHF